MDRYLTALLAQPGGDRIAGLVFGRFQVASQMTDEALHVVLGRHRRLAEIPVIAGVDS